MVTDLWQTIIDGDEVREIPPADSHYYEEVSHRPAPLWQDRAFTVLWWMLGAIV
jgi:hypothetical protein